MVDTDLELLFRIVYRKHQRTGEMYRELDSISNEEDIELFKEELRDRFGAIPEKSVELIEIVRLRKKAIALGIEKIVLKNNVMLLYFIANQESAFYQSPIFGAVLQYVQQHPRTCVMKEIHGKLTLRFEHVSNVLPAIELLEEIKVYKENC